MHLLLRDWQLQDLEPFVRWMAPGHLWQTLNAPYLPHPAVDPAQVERTRRRIEARDWDSPRTRLVVADAETNELLGQVSWYWESIETNWLSIGIVLYDPSHWGQGVGTEALGRWTDYLFAEMPQLVRLGMRTWSGNPGMMRVATRLGFQEEARFRRARIVDGQHYDSVGYGVLREEWEARWPDGFRAELRLDR